MKDIQPDWPDSYHLKTAQHCYNKYGQTHIRLIRLAVSVVRPCQIGTILILDGLADSINFSIVGLPLLLQGSSLSYSPKEV